MIDEREQTERGLPTGLTDDIAALAAVMAEHGLEKIQVNANGIRVSLSAPRTAKPGETANVPVMVTVGTETAEPSANSASNGFIIAAPMIGTFYTAPSPAEEAFVRVGDLVAPGQTVAIIEAMKIMNEIQAERGGIVEELLVSNGQPVEYNQPLIRLAQ